MNMTDRGSVGFRLFLGVALTLLVLGGVAYWLFAGAVREERLDEGRRDLVAAVAAVAKDPHSGSSRAVLRGLVTQIASDPEVLSAEVRDGSGRVVARSASAGGGIRGDRVRTGVRLRGEDYGVTAVRDRARVDLFLLDLRDTLLMALPPALVLALGLFWLLAGRSVQLRHRSALERALRDALTELGDHRAFSDEMRRASAMADRTGMEYTLALFDVNDFKFLNDRRGHQHGDEVLRKVARILSSGRGQDRAFRVGGDEFALLLPATSEHDGAVAVGRLLSLLADESIAVSCGLTASRPALREWSTLREEADAALYEAKRRRNAEPVRFSDFAERAFIVTGEKAQQVRLMIRDRGVDVALQPIWDVEANSLIGFEGLARPLPTYELAGPAEAFDVAEQIGRIGDLDHLCVARILERADTLPAGALLFINIHPASLEDERGGPGWLLEAAREAGLHPSRIVIEVTERHGARLASVVRAINQLRGAGFRVALDDVGAGNSGLEMLNATRVDFVKIDRAVVANAAADVNARAVLAAISAFAHETGTFVIAEGIEEREHLDFVRNLRVSVEGAIRGGQGYGLGRPAATVAAALAGPRAAAFMAPAAVPAAPVPVAPAPAAVAV